MVSTNQLSTGTYIALVELLRDQIEIKFVNSDGTNYFQYLIPVDHADFYASPSGVSPDGKYFAYYTGSIPGSHLAPPFHLSLHIFSLERGEIIESFPLLSEDFPSNFEEIAVSDFAKSLPEDEYSDIHQLATFFRDAFEYGIFSLDWSADGRYLAFASQHSGLSSDVYVYDLQRQKLQRYSFGLEQVQFLNWLEDNRIFYGTSIYGLAIEKPMTYQLSSLDGRTIAFPRTTATYDAGWLSPSLFLRYRMSNYCGNQDLLLFDTNTGQARNIWPYCFSFVAVDPNEHTILTTLMPMKDEEEGGLYLLSEQGSLVEKIAEWGIGGVFLNHPKYSYFVYISDQPALISRSGNIEFLDAKLGGQGIPSPDGSMIMFPHQKESKLYFIDTGEEVEISTHDKLYIQWSPDSNFIALYDPYRGQPLSIYSVEIGELYEIGGLLVNNLFWVEDSSGLFVLSKGVVYYSTPDGEYQVIVDQNYQTHNSIYLYHKTVVIE